MNIKGEKAKYEMYKFYEILHKSVKTKAAGLHNIMINNNTLLSQNQLNEANICGFFVGLLLKRCTCSCGWVDLIEPEH